MSTILNNHNTIEILGCIITDAWHLEAPTISQINIDGECNLKKSNNNSKFFQQLETLCN